MATTKEPFRCLSADTLLAVGGTGSVHRINEFVVLKTPTQYDGVVDPFWSRMAEEAVEYVAEEKTWYSLLDATPHPHILQSFMSTVEGIFLPRMTMDLKYRIITATAQPIDVRAKYRWIKELAAAAASLESLKLAHCDIRPGNVFIDEEEHVKLGDFESITRYGENPTLPVAPHWVWYDKCCGSKHDLFGIGNTIWELSTGVEYNWGTPEDPHFIPDTTGVDFGDVISRCWNFSYSTISDLAQEAEARYLEIAYGAFASVFRKIPFVLSLIGERSARVLKEKELAHGRAIIEKFLIDQTAAV